MVALRGKRPAKSTRAGLHLGKLEELGCPLTKSNYSESVSHAEPGDRTTYVIGEQRFQEEEPFYLITCQT